MAGTTHSYTEEEIIEFILCREDPIYFIDTYVKIEHPTFGMQDFSLYPYQIGAVQTYEDHKNVIQLSSRQMGNDALSAAYLLWYAIFHHDRTIVAISAKNDDSKEYMQRIRFMYEQLPAFLQVSVIENNKNCMRFDNGCRIMSRNCNPNSCRGMGISLLLLRDFGWIKHQTQTEFLECVMPVVASVGTQLIVTSTGYNPSDSVFNKMFTDAHNEDSSWKPLKIHYRERPGINSKWVEETKAQMGDDHFDLEFELKGSYVTT